jgi:low molecular weight phosphotyrosine protein phosphatase
MAEAVLRHELSRRPDLKNRFEVVVDSAGTGAYHEGDDADDRCVEARSDSSRRLAATG